MAVTSSRNYTRYKERNGVRVGAIGVSGFTPASLYADGEGFGYWDTTNSIIYQDSGNTTVADTASDPVEGSATDLSGNGNDFDCNGSILGVDNLDKFYVDTVGNLGFVNYASAAMPSTFTHVVAMDIGSDLFGMMLSDTVQAEGFGIFQANSSTTLELGYTGTITRRTINGIDISGTITRQNLLDYLTDTGKMVFTQTVTNITSFAGTSFGVGKSYTATLDSNPKIYGMLGIDRALLDEEHLNVVAYYGNIMGLTLTGSLENVHRVVGWKQSNTEGRASSGGTIATTTNGFEINEDGQTIVADPLVDPVGGAVISSMWPALCNAWATNFNERVAAIDAATGSSEILPYSTAGWGTTGGNRTGMDTALAAADTLMSNNKQYNVTNTTFFTLDASASEIVNDNGTTITPAAMETALNDFANDIATDYASTFNTVAIVVSGQRFDDTSIGEVGADSTTSNGYRLAEVNSGSNANITITYKGAGSFPGRGMMLDVVHHNIAGSQEAANCGVTVLAGNDSDPTMDSNPYLRKTEFIDATDANKTTISESLSTGADTSFIAVLVVGATHSGGADTAISGTFGGISMQVGGFSRAAGTGRINATVLYMHEGLYGDSLENVTDDLVITSTQSQNIMHAVVLESDRVYYVDSIDGVNNVTASTTGDHESTPLIDSWVVNLTGATLASATPSSLTYTNLTELVDNSLTRTKTVHIGVGHTYLGAETTGAFGVDYADSMQELVSVSVAFRPKYVCEADI